MVKTKAKRPFIWLSSAFMIGIICGVFAAKKGYFVSFIIPMLVLSAIIAAVLYKKLRSVAVAAVLFVTAAFFYSFFTYNVRNDIPDIGEHTYTVSATVLDITSVSDDKISFEAENVTLDGNKLASPILITLKGNTSVLPGDRITFTGELLFPKEARNSKIFDYRSYLADKGIYYVSYPETADIISVEQDGKASIIARINRNKHWLLSEYGKYLSEDALAIISAVSLGDKVLLDDDTSSLYRTSGTAHLLVISGLHVGFIVLILSFLTRPLKKNGILRFIINVFFIWAYIALTGLSVSAVRAGIFFSLFLLGEMLQARRDTVNITFVTALIMLIADPLLLFSVGFQLSFSAVLGIGILSPKVKRFLNKKLHFPANAASDVATVFTGGISVLPAIAYHFNTVSLVSVLANFIIVPLFSYIVILSFILLLTVLLNIPFVIQGVATVINGLVFVIKNILGFMTSFEHATLTVPSPDIAVIIAFAIIIIIFSVEKPLFVKHKFAVFATMLIIIVADSVIPYTGLIGQYRVSFIDVGQAECTLIRTPENKTILVDAGTSYGTSDTAEYTIIPFILKHGNASIDYLVLSHPHSDHIGEVPALLDGIKVKNLVLSYPENDVPEEFLPIIDSAREKNIKLINMFNVADVPVDSGTALHRASSYYAPDEGNTASLVLDISCRNYDLLFAGDMSADGLAEIPDIESLLIYKVAHHGSLSGISSRIAELKPKYSVIFTKEGNSYNLPAEETLDFLSQFSEVYSTSESGEITFTFSDGDIRIFKYIK